MNRRKVLKGAAALDHSAVLREAAETAAALRRRADRT
jgi:hypothetical protein